MSPNMMFLVVLVHMVLLYPAEGQNYQYFTQSPRNQTVYVGDNVTFTCRSQYIYGCDQHAKFYWYSSTTSHPLGRSIAGCYGVTDDGHGIDHTTIEFDTQNMQFHLSIQNVQLQDFGKYWCLRYTDANFQDTSEKASLTVLLGPRPAPSCKVTSPPNPRVGETVSLACTLAEDDPSTDIHATWYIKSPNDYLRISSVQKTQGRLSQVSHTLQETDNMKEFVCVAGPDFNTGPRCSVSPLHINVPTRVFISSTSRQVHEGDSAVFICESRPHLIADEYIWRISPTDGSQVTINRATRTLNSFDGFFNMTRNILEIPAVSLDFHNSEVSCTADYRGIYSNSLNRSRLIVLSVTTLLSSTPSTAAATAQETQDPSIPKTEETHFGTNIPNQQSTSSSIMATMTQNVPKEDNDIKTPNLPIGVLVGGVLAILLLLVTIILFVCFLVRSKRNVSRRRQVVAGSPTQESAGQHTVTAGTSVETDLTHLNLPSDDQSHPTQPNLSSEETTECETVLYAIPDKTMRGEVKHFTKTPPANKTSTGHGFVSLPRDLEPASSKGKNGHDSHEMVVYAQVTDTNIKRYPKPNADKPASQDEDTEELNYADLDFNRGPQGAARIDAIYAKPHKGPKK